MDQSQNSFGEEPKNDELKKFRIFINCNKKKRYNFSRLLSWTFSCNSVDGLLREPRQSSSNFVFGNMASALNNLSLEN